ncbi:basic salivary proline-rich protein 1-like [Canis lupus dingo]|uniref:basic salivary proline-rich protein 1-like n=1 Tax=Canis lupus dingo TaxID=286419 RepID=UPI000DC667EB|nr:basic salivary proline-rich protein 1-like [Canis lupus dingo]
MVLCKKTPSARGYAVPGLEVLLPALWVSRGGPPRSIPDSARPSWRTGWWSPLPRAGPARRKHLREPKCCRPRPQLASHRGPLLAPPSPGSVSGSPTRRFRDRARVPSRSRAAGPRRAHNRRHGAQERRRPVKGAAAGAHPPGAPGTGRGGPRGAERGPVSPGRSPQPPPASRPRCTGGHGAPRLPRRGARLPPGPSSRPAVGELRRWRLEGRPSSPVRDAQRRESTKAAKKDAGKGALLWLGLSAPRNPPQVPSGRRRRRRRRPAGRGHSGQPGRGGRAGGRDGSPPRRRVPASTSQKARSARRPTPASSRSLPASAAPARLFSAPQPRELDERSASAPPPPPAPPRPPRPRPHGRPEVAGVAAELRERRA